jgi:hypothetical protein
VSPVGPEHEAPQARDAGASDAVTFAFGDPTARLYGLARAGRVPGEPPSRSGMGLLFDGAEPAAVRAEGPEGGDEPAGVVTEVVEPLRRWRVHFADAFELDVEALAPPAVLEPRHAVAKAGGMQGYEQLCRFRGTVAGRRVDCLGQRGHSWGAPDWSKLALTRTITAWLDTETAVTLTAVRPASARHHGDEAIAASLVQGGTPVTVAEPLVSTTTDADGRQRHAGLELWLDGDDAGGYPYRAAGEVLCGTTLDLGRLRLDAAFFAWRMEGRTGVGRYDVLRHAA